MPIASNTLAEHEADNLRTAWLDMTSSLPQEQEYLIAQHRLIEAALDLVEYVIGHDQLIGWRLTFTSVGGPYSATLFVRRTGTVIIGEIRHEDDLSLSAAIVDVIRTWLGNSTPPTLAAAGNGRRVRQPSA